MTESQYVSSSYIAQSLGISRMTVYRMLDAGTFSYLRVGKGYRIPVEEFEAWKQANTVSSLSAMRLLEEQDQPEVEPVPSVLDGLAERMDNILGNGTHNSTEQED